MAHRKPHLSRGAVLGAAFLVAALAGCGEATPEPGVPQNATDGPAPAKKSKVDDDQPPPLPSKGSSGGGDLSSDQRAQMEIALRRGGEKAANCATVVPDGPRGEGEVKVTFDGKIGKATEVEVGPPFAGTPVESCIKRSFVGEYVMPFEGKLEVPYTVKLPPKQDEGKKDPKAKDPKAKDPKAKDAKKKAP